MMKREFNTSLTFSVGNVDMAQKRRAAYLKTAERDQYNSLGSWIRTVLDKAAKFDERKFKKGLRRSF